MELIIALALFLGLIVTWLLLPGSATTSSAPEVTISTAQVNSSSPA